MCGFTGYVSVNYALRQHEYLEKMTEEIKHRGPDSVGYYKDENVGLGFRRLSIIGLENGGQPLFNEDENLVLCFNGEIYNYEKLKEELIEKGHIFAKDCDSEVLLHGYEEYGIDLLYKLRGMYAFVIWDKKNRTLFVARDPFGIKPLYYTLDKEKNTLYFASEIKSMLKNPNVKKELNEDAIKSFLAFQYSAREESFFKGIYELMPGNFFIYKNGEMFVHCYQELTFDIDESLTEEEAVTKIENVFEDSVKAHLTSDTEVGCFLSGGVDSSYVVSTAKCPKAFTVGFAEKGYSEIEYAKELAGQLGIDITTKEITSDEYFESIPKIMYHMDEPTADPAAVALYFVSKEAAKKVKVVCSGEGADELFGGYNVYQSALATDKMKFVPACIRHGMAKLMSAIPVHFKGKEFLIRSGLPLEKRFIGNAHIFSDREIDKVLVNKKAGVHFSEVTKKYYDQVEELGDVEKMQYIDQKTWLRGDILRKADRMSMANSLELRVPFLDKEVFAVSRTLPTRLKVTPNETKLALRKAALKNTPKASTVRKKLGFPVPIRVWMRQEKYRDMVRAALHRDYMAKYFNIDFCDKLLDEHFENKKDNSRKLWCLYCFAQWYQVYFC